MARARRSAYLAAALLLVASVAVGDASARSFLIPHGIPPEYADLYAFLAGRLTAFESDLAARWNGSRADVAFSAELLTANANRGTALLSPSTYDGVRLELSRFAGMGLKAVTVSLGFPILDPAFYPNPSDFEGYIAFYKRLATDVRAAGLRLIVKAGVLFPTYVDLPVAPYYGNLTYAAYIERRVAMVVLVAREIAPDWLGFGSEPDTEERLTGQPVASPAAYTAFAKAVVENVTAAGLEVPLGAGVGTWDPAWRAYGTSYAENTSLDFIDVHVYPVNFDFLPRLWDLADLARAGGKALAIGEAWLYKARDAELMAGVYFDEIFRRDAYDFWGPLDGRFLADLVNYSHAEGLAFLSPYWSKFLHAYLDYGTAAGMTYAEVVQASNQAAVQAMLAGCLSASGTAYATAIGGWPTTGGPARGNLGGLVAVVGVALAVLAAIGWRWMRGRSRRP